MAKTAGIIIVGNEILSGKVRDENSGYLAARLRELGVELRRISVIPDDLDIIAREVREFSGAYDFVFTSGGVGPTHDDMTIRGVARGFGVATAVHPVLRDIIASRCGIGPGDSSMKMAEIPEGGRIIEVDDLKFPPIVMENVYIFPGIPQYLRNKFEAICERFRSAPFALRKVYVTEEECDIVAALDRLDAQYGDVEIGSYPVIDNPEYKVVITLEGADAAVVESCLKDLMSSLPKGSVLKSE